MKPLNRSFAASALLLVAVLLSSCMSLTQSAPGGRASSAASSPDSKKMPGHRLYRAAVDSGDPVAFLEGYVRSGGRIDIPGNDGFTALHIAALYKNFPVAEFLLKNGADIRKKTLDGTTAGEMMLISMKSNEITEWLETEIPTILIERGLDPNALFGDGATILHRIAWQRNTTEATLKLARLLLSRGADPALKNNAGYSAFADSIAFRPKPELLRLMLDKELAKASTIDLKNLTRPARDNICQAVESMQKDQAYREVAMVLAEAGFDGGIQDRDGDSLLRVMLSSYSGFSIEFLEKLLDNGLPLSGPYSADPKRSLFRDSARKEDAGLIRLLLARGMPLTDKERAEAAALDWMEEPDQLECVRVLLSRGFDINKSVGWYGHRSLLLDAVTRDRPSILELCLDLGADPRIDDSRWPDIFHAAADKAGPEIMGLLLGGLAYADAPDAKGRTALHIAAARPGPYNETIRLLVGAGASLDAIDDGGYTPLAAAVAADRMDVALFLIEAGSDASAPLADRGRSLLDIAVLHGREDIIRFLLERYPNLSLSVMERTIFDKLLAMKGPVGYEWYYGAASSPIAGGGYGFPDDRTCYYRWRSDEKKTWELEGRDLRIYDASGKEEEVLDWYDMKWPGGDIDWCTFRISDRKIDAHLKP